jgi:hypothetical protein
VPGQPEARSLPCQAVLGPAHRAWPIWPSILERAENDYIHQSSQSKNEGAALLLFFNPSLSQVVHDYCELHYCRVDGCVVSYKHKFGDRHYLPHHIAICCVNYCRYRVLTFHILFVLVINLSLICSCCLEREMLMTLKNSADKLLNCIQSHLR